MVPNAACDIGSSTLMSGELLVEVLGVIINSIFEKLSIQMSIFCKNIKNTIFIITFESLGNEHWRIEVQLS